jgi:hypothetical protein
MANKTVEDTVVDIIKEDIFTQRQIDIAKKTLKMNDAMANVMGGMNKKESIEVLRAKAKMSDSAITSLLKQSGHTPEEIKKLLAK